MRRQLPVAALALLAAFLLSGCGTGGIVRTGDPIAGKRLFLQNCGSCHTLADAGTKGVIGPNLDDSFRSMRLEHFKQSTIKQVVADQIKFAIAPMPANLVTGANVDNIAVYVSQCAASTCNVAAPVAVASGGGPGAAAFTALGCSGCHSLNGSPGTGPTLKGVAGSQVKLANGQTVTADDAYLLRSIEDPDSQIVAGFKPGIMTTLIKPHSVPLAKAKQLVAFIKAQK